MERADRLAAARLLLRRLALHRLRAVDLDEIVREVIEARALERVEYHFQRHGEFLGATTAQEYIARLEQHLAKTDLIHFALVRRQGDLMWYAAAIDSGITAQYNVDRKRLWSFFRAADLQQFIDVAGAIRIEQRSGKWEIVDEETDVEDK